MYDIIFKSDHQKDNFTVVASNIATLEEANRKRVVSGDVVVHPDTRAIVVDEAWLFDWEKGNQDSYAFKEIASEKKRLEGQL